MTNLLNRSMLILLGTIAVVSPVSGEPGQPVQATPSTAVTPSPHPTVSPGQSSGVAPRATQPRGDSEGSDRTAPQAFSVVLVLGDAQTAAMQDNVPAAARKALADMKDFLPYKGYRLLDAQWTLCCGSHPITSRLKGADEQEYDLQLSTTNISNGRVNVRFYLSEPDGGGDSTPEIRARIGEIERQIEGLRRQSNARPDRGGKPVPENAEMRRLSAQIESLRREAAELKAGSSRARHGRGVIDASFRMDVGETVVVGTSRTRGDKALIALLTAVPPKAPAAR